MGGEAFKELTLDDVADFRNGKAIPPEKYSLKGRYPVFGANGQIARSNSVLNPEPVIAIGRVGAYCGSVYYISQPSWVTDNAIVAIAKESNDLRFLYYLLASLDLRRTAIGSAQPLMTQGGLKVVQTLVPPLKVQQAIACVLGALDDKIELNTRMNRTLEAMARAIFKSWFVDFDPVRAKAAGQQPHGLKPELAALFPGAFEGPEIGGIPKGWRVGTLGEIAKNPRRSIQPDKIDSAMVYIALEHMPKRCIALSDWGTTEGIASNKFEFRTGEILFGKLRPYFHKVGVAPVDGLCSTDIVVVDARSEHWFGYVLGHMSSDAFVKYTDTRSTGTKMPRTNWSDMSHYPVVIPSQPIAKAFTNQARWAVDRIIAGIHESRTLAALRNTLSPKLISGELQVPDAERIVKRCA